MPGARLWSLDSPCLYHAEVCLTAGDELLDRAEVRFGMREPRVEGFRVLLNGTPVFLRGGCDER
jgi:beta-galactosidase/beta-glucuronidase